MCAIFGWKGPLPPGFIHQILVASEFRGKDSTGIAFRDQDVARMSIVKQAIPASVFVRSNRVWLDRGQRASLGIGHVRKASHSMPVDNVNAHPYNYRGTIFAHNGALKNWRLLREDMLRVAIESKNTFDEAYAKAVTTDSMMLGPALKSFDLSGLQGSFGLVWSDGQTVYAARSHKELSGAVIKWRVKSEGSSAPLRQLNVISTLWSIIESTLKSLHNVSWTAEEVVLDQNMLYEIRADDIYAVRPLTFSAANSADAFSSAAA